MVPLSHEDRFGATGFRAWVPITSEARSRLTTGRNDETAASPGLFLPAKMDEGQLSGPTASSTCRSDSDLFAALQGGLSRIIADKRTLLFAVLNAAIASDARPVPVTEREWFRQVLEEPDAHRQLELFASAARGIHERTGDLFRVLQSAAAVDPEVARHLTLHAEGQVEDERRLVASLAAKSALRPGLSPDEALETVWALTTLQFFAQVSQHGWSPSRYEQWLADALVRLLLPEARAQSGHGTD